MTKYPIVIHSLTDVAAGREMFPELSEEPLNLEVKTIGIREAGMSSGKPSMFIILADAEGKTYKLGMGCEAYLTIGAGVKGAMERFGHPWTGP